MAKTKAAPEADLLDDLVALEPRLEAELADEHTRSTAVRTHLMNIGGSISALKDAVSADKAMIR